MWGSVELKKKKKYKVKHLRVTGGVQGEGCHGADGILSNFILALV